MIMTHVSLRDGVCVPLETFCQSIQTTNRDSLITTRTVVGHVKTDTGLSPRLILVQDLLQSIGRRPSAALPTGNISALPPSHRFRISPNWQLVINLTSQWVTSSRPPPNKGINSFSCRIPSECSENVNKMFSMLLTFILIHACVHPLLCAWWGVSSSRWVSLVPLTDLI